MKGKLPAGVWAKLDFTQAEVAARAYFRADSLKEFISAMRAQEETQDNNKIRLEKGDVILYVDRGWFTGVSVSQGANRFLIPTSNFSTYKGSIYTHHAAVVAEDGAMRLGVAHSGGTDGVSFQPADAKTGVKLTPKVYGSYMVFRLKNAETRQQWAEKISNVARVWTKGASQRGAYADVKDLVAAGVNSSSYGPKAIARMEWYVKHAKENGLSGQKLFCSQFVIAVYQAALGKASKELMALHADYTSPMKLHHYLADTDKVWKLVGTEKY